MQASISRKSSSPASLTRWRNEQQRSPASSEFDRVARQTLSETLLQQSLVNLQTYIDNLFASFTSNITLDATERVSKRLKYSTYDFKFKRNKDQFNFNKELIDSLQETLVAPKVGTFFKVVQRIDRSFCFSCGLQGHWKNSCPILHTSTRQNFRPGVQSLFPTNQPGERARIK